RRAAAIDARQRLCRSSPCRPASSPSERDSQIPPLLPGVRARMVFVAPVSGGLSANCSPDDGPVRKRQPSVTGAEPDVASEECDRVQAVDAVWVCDGGGLLG